MLNNLTNFFNLIVGRKVKTTANPDDLVALGVRDPRTPGIYQPAAIKVSDLVPPAGVTAVTGTSPVVSSGGSTPAISMPAATNSVNGYLTAADRTTFNNKQAALVSGTNIRTVNSNTLLGSGDIAVQPTLVSGTNIKTVNGTTILGSGNLVISTGIGGIHVPFGVASANFYTNTVLASQMATTQAISTTGLLGLTPFRPSVGFTAGGFGINVTAGGGTHSGRVLIYEGNQDGTVTRVVNATLNPLTTGLAIVSTTYTFVAGTTYWIGWNCNFASGTLTVTACRESNMAPLTLTQPITTPTCNFGYSTASFTTGTPPATIDLSTYTETAANCVQIFIQAS